MFYGVEKRILDKNGRINLPRKTVEKLGRQPFVIRQDQTLLLYPEERKKDFPSSRVEEVRFDNYGRLCLPKKIVHSLMLMGRKVALSGEGDHIAIRPRRRLSYEELTVQEAEEFARRGISVVPDADRKKVSKMVMVRVIRLGEKGERWDCIEKSHLLNEIREGKVVGVPADQAGFTLEDVEALYREGFYTSLEGKIAWINAEHA